MPKPPTTRVHLRPSSTAYLSRPQQRQGREQRTLALASFRKDVLQQCRAGDTVVVVSSKTEIVRSVCRATLRSRTPPPAPPAPSPGKPKPSKPDNAGGGNAPSPSKAASPPPLLPSGPPPDPSAQPASSTQPSKPGNGQGDKNHRHTGPPAKGKPGKPDGKRGEG